MAHLKKFGKTATGHMTKHYERAKDEFGEYIKFGNQDIDITKTHLNYNLASNGSNQVEFIKNRCKEVKCLNREDVKVMCSWVVTKPKNISDGEERDFFKETYKFLENRYGKENVISAYVHKDETTPHMHFSFVPVVYDKKKELYKVSAKERVSRNDLRSFHADLERHLEKCFGRQVGILNEATKEGNKSIEELKRGTAIDELKNIKLETSKIVSKTKKQVEDMEHRLIPIKVEYEARKAFIDQSVKDSDVSVMYPSYVEVKKKGLIKKQEYVTVPKEKWEDKHISANQINAILREREVLDKKIKEIRESEPMKKIEFLVQEVKELKKQNWELSQSLDKANHQIERVNKVFSKDSEIKEKFFKIEKEIQKSKGFNIER